MRGVYFLANDKVIDLTIAFLNSFRCHNQSEPLCLIPFNHEIAKTVELMPKYNFSIFADESLLVACDDISSHFYGHTCGQYRKLAMWEGVFEEFVYIDVDTIILENIDFSFGFLRDYDFITSHSNIERIKHWVWKESINGAGRLTQEQINYAANTGFIVSRRHELTLREVGAKLSDALALASHMELFCAEQPLLNFLIVTSGKRYSSLFAIARQARRVDIPLERWAGMWFGDVREGRVVRPPTHPPVLLVHWAGEWHRGCHESHPLWRYYRDIEGA